MKLIWKVLTSIIAAVGVCSAGLVFFILIYSGTHGAFKPIAGAASVRHSSVTQDEVSEDGEDHFLSAQAPDNTGDETVLPESNATEEGIYVNGLYWVDSVEMSGESEEARSVPGGFESNQEEYDEGGFYESETDTAGENYSENEAASQEGSGSAAEDVAAYNDSASIPDTPDTDSVSVGKDSSDSSYIAGTPVQSAEGRSSSGSNFNTYNNPDQQITEDTYVLNTNTMKIHRPSCRHVKKIALQNYETSSLSLDELLKQGYEECKVCLDN